MTLTFTASTGARILVWREDDMFAAARAGTTDDAQICMGVDLFEVIADLAGLDLEVGERAAEATRIADEARRQLSSLPAHRPSTPDAHMRRYGSRRIGGR